MTSINSSSLLADDQFYDQSAHDPMMTNLQNGDSNQEETWRNDLARLENEIKTLKSVLRTKESQSEELKRRLGITSIMEFRSDLSQGFQAIKESETVQKTNEKIHMLGDSIASTEAYQKTNAALKSMGAFASRKFGDLRNSGTFKTVEDKMGGAFNSVKHSKSLHTLSSNQNQFTGSKSTDDFKTTPPQ